MGALTDHKRARLWFEKDKCWINLKRGEKGHLFLHLFDFINGGMCEPPEEELTQDARDFELVAAATAGLDTASAEAAAVHGTNSEVLRHAARLLTRSTRGPWADSHQFQTAADLAAHLGIPVRDYKVLSVNVSYRPRLFRLFSKEGDVHRCTIIRNQHGDFSVLETFTLVRTLDSKRQAVPEVDGGRPPVMITIFAHKKYRF